MGFLIGLTHLVLCIASGYTVMNLFMGNWESFFFGLAVIGIDTVIGTVLTHLFGFEVKINKLRKNPYHIEEISVSEIVMRSINLRDARNRLEPLEYVAVAKTFDTLRTHTQRVPVDYENYAKMRNDIIAYFDLIAPFYKFCGNDRFGAIEAALESKKRPYRIRAKMLMGETTESNLEEFYELHEEFVNEFYSWRSS